MGRSEFHCPIDEHLCNDSNCSRSHCSQQEREAVRERRAAEKEAKIRDVMMIFDIDRVQAIDLVNHPEHYQRQPTSPKAPG
jgi:hypothetical protein